MTDDRPVLDLVEAVHVLVPFRRPFEAAHGVFTARSSWIVRLGDRDGRQGFGEVALDPSASKADLIAVGRAVREAVDLLTDGLTPDWSARGGSGPIGRAVRAGVDSAFGWLARDGAEEPAEPISVAVNATLDFAGPTEAAEAAARAVSAGFSTLKIKVVGAESPVALAARLTAIRRAVGGSVKLRLDVNGSWDLATAVGRLNALVEYDIDYVEQPLAAADVDGHAVLRRETPVPIALDESVTDDAAVRRILDAGAADVLVVKPARVGGPVVVRAIAARAVEAGVPVVLSTFFETGVGTVAAVHAAAALPPIGPERAHGLATAGLLEHDLLVTPMAVMAGRIYLPHGLELDPEALERYAVEKVGQQP
jgi:L-Ala-D/L-Glu epimerase